MPLSISGVAPLPAPASPSEHAARVIAAIERAVREIPFYVSKGRVAPPAGVELDAALTTQPLLFKSDVRTSLPRMWAPEGTDVRGALASGELELVETGGTAEDRIRVLRARGAWGTLRELALGANPVTRAALGNGPVHEATLMAPERGGPTCHSRDLSFEERLLGQRLWLHTRGNPVFWPEAELDRMIAELARHETVALEADPAYLAPLARRAHATGRALDVRGFVALGHGITTPQEARAIDEAIRAPRLTVYGATETGPLFMEHEDGRLRHATGATHVELLPAKVPTPGAEDVALVVVTTLGSAHPLVRYVLGDLVQIDRAASCAASGVAALLSVEGRVQDALLLPSGAMVTAGAFTRAAGSVEGVRSAQAGQPSPTRIEVDVVLEDGAGEAPLEALRAKLHDLCAGAEVTLRRATALAAEPNGRFRWAKRAGAIDWGATFAGCETVRTTTNLGALTS